MKIKVDIEQELDSKRKESKENGDQIVDSAKLLLEADHAKETDLLKKLGLGHQIIKAEEHRGLNIERENLENKYEGKVFTGAEIKSICMDYNLRFLSTRKFKGTVDLELGVKIRNFFEKHKLNDNSGGVDTDSFFIMAPKKAFNLEDRPKPTPVDPVLFYRPSRNEDKYLLVHKWGNEFTVLRLISGLMNRSSAVHFMFVWGISVCIMNIVYAFFGNYSPITDFIFGLVWGSLFFFIYIIAATNGGNDSDKFERQFSDQCWDSVYHN